MDAERAFTRAQVRLISRKKPVKILLAEDESKTCNDSCQTSDFRGRWFLNLTYPLRARWLIHAKINPRSRTEHAVKLRSMPLTLAALGGNDWSMKA